MITIEQIKAARGLLDWTQDDLARAASVSKPLINTIERRIANPKVDSLLQIQKALEKAGVEFTEGPGVKLRSAVLKTQILEGDDGFIRLLHDIFDTLKGTDKELMISGIAEEKYIGMGERVVKEVRRRNKHGIRTKLLSCEGDLNFLEPIAHYRWLPRAFFPTTPSYVYDHKYALLLFGPPSKVVLVENSEIAESHRRQFLAHWAAAKVPDPDWQAE